MTDTITVSSNHKHTFESLAVLEPKLNVLLEQARNTKGCISSTWYGGGLRTAMKHTVGHLRTEGPDELRTSQAYDLAYRKLWDALPNCPDEECRCIC